jgi:hypothetical protein
MTTPKRANVSDAPMALASDGMVLVNLTHLQNGDVLEAARKHLDQGHQIFVGLVVPERHRAGLAKDFEDAASELTCRMGGRLVRRK